MGLVNQLPYTFAAAEQMLPFWELLKAGSLFHWIDELIRLFNGTNALIISRIYQGVEILDKSRPVCLEGSTDWNREDIGGRCFDDIPNPCPRNLKEKSLRFCFRDIHITGLRHAAADAASRKFVGKPEFISLTAAMFFRNWGVNYQLSSVAFPHSNGRAEVGVKTIKHVNTYNTSLQGSLDTEKFQRSLLQNKNTLDRDTRLSPAKCIFGRPIQDFIPIHPGKYQLHNTWRETLVSLDEALRNRHMCATEGLSEHTRILPPLAVVTASVSRIKLDLIQPNGPRQACLCQFDQYMCAWIALAMLPSARKSFLRKFILVIPWTPIMMAPSYSPTMPTVHNEPTTRNVFPLKPNPQLSPPE
ncbi:enzymatic polyprotein [Plakobranchus ocellatus]|uniref:Enzymatic polyprotein n=1 Tax=Plakobranchus ocellatus TaxID=259542 RepID=A0AAV3Y2G1_9GAST|nr:enzymatic polyprotein [Plakobranchus ocellatus]